MTEPSISIQNIITFSSVAIYPNYFYFQYGLEEEQRNRLLRTYIRNAFSFHLNEIFSAVRNEYTDWDKPVQHPINIRYALYIFVSNKISINLKKKNSQNFSQKYIILQPNVLHIKIKSINSFHH